MKKIIVTGATGFVGANLVRRLLKDGHEVHVLIRPGYAHWRIDTILHDLMIHIVNLSDAQALRTTVEAIKPDWIFHLAANGAYSWQNNADQILSTNFQGTINLVNASLHVGFETFVNTGSSSEYGYKTHAPSENEYLEPNSYYAVSKASATQFCRFTATKEKVRIPTLRLYSVYGPFEDPRRLIPSLILKGKSGLFPPLVNPSTARDFIYAEDVIDTYLLTASKPIADYGAVYNVGSGTQTTLKEAVALTRNIFHISKSPSWNTMSARSWDTNVWIADIRKIQSDMGWQPAYSFEKGFKETIDWFLKNASILPVID
jgi:UDP-glucose 4-epimerase